MTFFSKFVESVFSSFTQTAEHGTEPSKASETIMTEETNTPQREEILDQYYTTPYGDFAIRKTRFGAYTSYDRELVQLVTGGTWEAVFSMTPCHLQWAREGYVAPEGKEGRTYDSVVGGKL